MQNGLLVAIIPSDGDASSILFGDPALLGLVLLPANTVAYAAPVMV
jgi:hypothetical protein